MWAGSAVSQVRSLLSCFCRADTDLLGRLQITSWFPGKLKQKMRVEFSNLVQFTAFFPDCSCGHIAQSLDFRVKQLAREGTPWTLVPAVREASLLQTLS